VSLTVRESRRSHPSSGSLLGRRMYAVITTARSPSSTSTRSTLTSLASKHPPPLITIGILLVSGGGSNRICRPGSLPTGTSYLQGEAVIFGLSSSTAPKTPRGAKPEQQQEGSLAV